MTRVQREINRVLNEMLQDIVLMHHVANVRFYNAYRYKLKAERMRYRN